MKKVLLIGLMVAAVSMVGSLTVKAGEKHAKAAKADKPTLQEMTVVGTVEKVEKQKKDGTDVKTTFKLTDADGTEVDLPKGQIEQYVGKKVKVTGQGFIGNNNVKHIKTITKIENADVAAVVPAAPAAPGTPVVPAK